ncbi:MAG: MFS transporter [Anaerolineaceae bacterium]|nr:MFS transporter [Anaerolineaceae bacterium]
MNSIVKRFSKIPRELVLFMIVTILMGLSTSMMDSTFNNFLDANFSLSGFQRSFLEFPRELPGFLVVFVSAALWFFCSRRLGGISFLLSAVGALCIGFLSKSYGLMIVWLFIYSLGQHLFIPLSNSIGMELAREGHTGKRLGQLNALRNGATIAGSFFIFIAFRYFNFTFKHSFLVMAVIFLIAALVMFRMQRQTVKLPKTFLKLHKEYRLYYILAVLYGSRKQLFITFAPWVLVTIFNQSTQTLATLLTIGGVIGILFQPLLGWAIDHLGERFVLITEALLLVLVCLGYAFGKNLFSEHIAFLIACVCFLLDQMLMSVNMARAMYMQKIAIVSEDVQPALTAGVTIDHIFSITIAILGGLIWNAFGYQYVFYLGMFIAVLNFLAALKIDIPNSGRPQTVK